ncbi:MAG: alpha/beta fold hydrolase [Pseudomonadota bacterium]
MSIILTILAIIVLILGCATAFTQWAGSKAAQALPARGKFTKVGKGRLHWVESGAGRPVVMIHGLGGNLHHFTYALSDALSGDFRAIAVDRPGCGWSERDGMEQASLSEQARMIAEFLEAEGIENPVIVGHSLGGAVSLALALNHPERVGTLALLCPATQPISETPEMFKGIDIPSPGMRSFIAHTISGPLGVMMKDKLFGAIFAPEPVSPDFDLRGGALLGARPELFISTSEDMVEGRNSVDDVAGREAELSVPVNVLYARQDEVLDPALHGETFSELAGANLEMIDGHGHMIPFTATEACADFIRRVADKDLPAAESAA